MPPDTSHRYVPIILPLATGARHRVVPLLQPHGIPDLGRYSEAVLRSYLQPQGLFKGVGETGFPPTEYSTVDYESPTAQTIFQVVNEIKGIVMFHPDAKTRDLKAVKGLEPSVIKYSDVIFLFHGGPLAFQLAAPLMSKYPNVYFTFDVCVWLFSGPVLDNVFLCSPKESGHGAGSSERFLADVNRIGVERLVESSLSRTLPLLRQYPDRIMWGTDRSEAWNYEDAITDVIIQASRQFIARLPAEIQEKYAYGNAQRVFGRYLSPGP